MIKGISEKVNQRTKASYTLSVLYDLIKKESDYNANRIGASTSPYLNKSERDKKLDMSARTLETIHESWPRQYTEQLLFDITNKRRGGYADYEGFRVPQKLLEEEETGVAVTQGELLQDKPEIATIDYLEAKKRLPYILKKLYMQSIRTSINLLSVIIAYEKAKHKKENYKLMTTVDILEQRVYPMNPNDDTIMPNPFIITGDYNTRFAKYAYPWVIEEITDAYTELKHELLHICWKIGIDIKQENPLDYNKDFIDSIVITSVEKNRRYLLGNNPINPDVIKRLSTIRLDEFSLKYDQETKVGNIPRYTITDLINTFKSSSVSKIIGQKGMDRVVQVYQMAFEFNMLPAIHRNYTEIMISKNRVEDEFFLNEDGTLYIHTYTLHCSVNPLSNIAVLYRTDGYALLLNYDINKMFFTDVVTLQNDIIAWQNNHYKESTLISNNKRLFTWEEL